MTDVSTAVKNCFPRKPRQYDKGHAIFIRWKEDDIEGTADQVRVLKDHFDRLRFTVDPSQFSTSIFELEPRDYNDEDNVFLILQQHLVEKVLEFGRQSNSLFVLYYGGHGKMEKRDCIWYAHESFKDCQREGRTLNWSKLAKGLVSGPGNVLFIIDSCSAVGMGIPDGSRGLKELFGACGINDVTSASESNAFTNCINIELNKLRRSQSQLSISALYATLLKCHKDKLQSTPYRIALSTPAETESIVLHYGVDSNPPNPTTTQETLDFNARVLVAIRLENPTLTPRVDDWTTWIKSFAPAGIIGVDVSLGYVHPVSLHHSGSTLLIASLPMAVWSLMPRHPAYAFIDLVQSGNLLSLGPHRSLDVKLEPDLGNSKVFLDKGKAKMQSQPAHAVEQHPPWSSRERTVMEPQSFGTSTIGDRDVNVSLSANAGSDDPNQKRFFACPYYRHDPRSHAGCVMMRISRIPDLVTHLRRKHVQPLHCRRCSREFSDLEELAIHLRAGGCLAREFVIPEGMTGDQLHQLSKRRVKGQSDEQKWMDIWSILFPGTPPRSSPFAGDYLEEAIGMLCDYWNAQNSAFLPGPIEMFLGDQPSIHQAASRMIAVTVERLLNAFLVYAHPPVGPEVFDTGQSSAGAANEGGLAGKSGEVVMEDVTAWEYMAPQPQRLSSHQHEPEEYVGKSLAHDGLSMGYTEGVDPQWLGIDSNSEDIEFEDI